MSEEKILVPAEEAARMLSMGRSTFWKAVKDQLAPAPVKIGGLTRWRVADLKQHVQAMQTTRP
jgi:predicted DNA-binding transcriptional regulator AlpA